jgi:hypothetical protein
MNVLLPSIGPKILRKKISRIFLLRPHARGERDLNFYFMLKILSGKVKESLGRKGARQITCPPPVFEERTHGREKPGRERG